MPGTMSARYVVMPIPPYAGGGPRAPHPHGNSEPHAAFHNFKFHFPAPGEHFRTAPDSCDACDAPAIGSGGSGPGIFGSLGSGSTPPRPPEPRPAAPSRPVFRSQGAQAALLIHRIDPLYPPIARQIHLSGTVELRAIIAKDGSVINLEVVSGNPILARSALDAVRQWRYRPTLLNGEPVEVQTFVTVNFVLQ